MRFGVTIAQNDNWQDDAGASRCAGTRAGARQRSRIRLLLTLPPGNYTAILSDVNGVTGVGLVEVYNVTNQ